LIDSVNAEELKILRDMVSLPTAPFCESKVQGFILEWAAQHGISTQQDKSGNILLTYKGSGRPPKNPWVLQAHMDHPGFEWIRRRGSIAWAWFRGGVQERYFPGERVRFFPESGDEVCGTVESVRRDKASGFLKCRIRLDDTVSVPEGTLGMWDLPAWRKSGDKLSLRVVDDLCGVASILIVLARLKASGCRRTVHGLLTRAEEVGFVGAIAAVKNKLIDPGWPVLGIEASKAQPNAKLGQGAIVRVGDASTVFDPDLTAHLRTISRKLARGNGNLKYVDALMPGGSCESTGLALMGYRTCAVCLPLGNYHNMGKHGIASEQIRVSDFESMVCLLVDVVQQSPDASQRNKLKKRLMENDRKRAPLLSLLEMNPIKG
jgi:endoglucanase